MPDPNSTLVPTHADLVLQLAAAVHDDPDAFHTALKDHLPAAVKLDLIARDERFLQWMAGWDSDTVACMLRLLAMIDEHHIAAAAGRFAA